MSERRRASVPAPVRPAQVAVVLGVAAVLSAGAASRGGAQGSPPGPYPGIFGEVLEVRVVNIEVVVTDRDGLRVTGLGPGDFRLFVDGEETAIDYFTEVRGGLALEAEGGRGEGATQGVPALAPGDPAPTSYLVYIDDYFALGRDRDQVLQALEEDLPRIGPEDRMAVVAFDGRRLEMLSSWSGSVPALQRTLRRARERRSHGLQRLAELRQADAERVFDFIRTLRTEPGLDSAFITSLEADERFYIERLADQLERSVTAAAAALRGFAAPPGRKVMLLLCGGWPFLPGEFIIADQARFVLDPAAPRGKDLFQPLVDTANLLGYTLYPVDVPGLSAATLQPEVTAGNLRVTRASSLREIETHFTLEYLAAETGGRPLLNAGRSEALAGAISDTRSYYWLGFTPRRRRDDTRHDVRVEVRNPRLRVRTRQGFVDSSRRAEATMAVESALLFGNPPGAGELEVEVGPARRAGRRRMEVPLVIRIPLDVLTFVPTGEGYAAQAELRVAVVDFRGNRAEIPVIPIALEIAAPPSPGARGRYETILRLRRLPHRAVVAVVDPAGGRMITGGVEIRP